MRGAPLACCARAASGHAAAPPSNVMNWRRLGSNMAPPGTRCASLPQGQAAPEAPAGPWDRPESFLIQPIRPQPPLSRPAAITTGGLSKGGRGHKGYEGGRSHQADTLAAVEAHWLT